MSKEQDKEVTKVIFRYWMSGSGAGGVIALMPETFADQRGYECWSYEHLGQHGGADLKGVISATRPANPDEYKDLYNELVSLGYNLKVIDRSPSWSRISQLRQKYLKSLADAPALKEKEV